MKRFTGHQTGLIILLGYVLVVITLELCRALLGWPIDQWLASSPALLGDGQWWRLITSAFVIDGSPVPQLIITAILGGLIIWLRGAWLFWGVVLVAHLLGTLLTYLVVFCSRGIHNTSLHHFLMTPDYGISLVWSSALGMVAAAAWLGPSKSWHDRQRPYIAGGAIVTMVIVVVLSHGDDALQHAIAFVVGAVLLVAFDRSGLVTRDTPIRRHG